MALTILNRYDNSDKLFKIRSIGAGLYTIQSSKVGGQYLNFLPKSSPCTASMIPGAFRITGNDDRSYSIADLIGYKLIARNFEENYVPLEPPDKTLYQRFDLEPSGS